MAATVLGSAVNFGFTGTDGIAESTILTGKIILQSADYSAGADEEQIRSAVGDVVTRSFYNAHNKATLEYVATGASKSAAQTNSTIPTPGTILSITACASIPGLVKTNWVVVGEPKVSLSNTTAARVSLNLEAHAGVTAAAT